MLLKLAGYWLTVIVQLFITLGFALLALIVIVLPLILIALVFAVLDYS